MAKVVAASGNPFTAVSADERFRLVWRSWGLDKTGKNHFGLTGPGPIFGQYFDPAALEGVAEKFIRGDESVGGIPKEISAKFYRFRKNVGEDTAERMEACKELRDEFVADYQYALKHARTIQWDETEFWAVCRFGEFGRESAKTREYGPINDFYRGLILDAIDAGVNLQLIQKVKQAYKDDKPVDGAYLPTGFKEAGYIVQLNVHHTWSLEEGFGIEIANCRQNMSLAGERFTTADSPGMTSFGAVAQMVYPDSTEEDWQ